MSGKHLHIRPKPFAYVALWQFLMFFMLILLIWINELMDLPALLFDAEPSPINYVSAYMISLGVLIVAIITVGHTYLQQKYIIKGMLKICSSCRRVIVNRERWEWVEEYVFRHSMALVSHGLCPACLSHEKGAIEEWQREAEHAAESAIDPVDDLH